MQIYAVRLNNYTDRETIFELVKYLDKSKKERIYRFKFLLNAYQTLIGGILARYIICKNLHLKNEQVKFKLSKFGKPFLVNYENFYFNISHSSKWVVFVCNSSNVGIDVEKIIDIDLDVVKTFCTQNEFKEFMNVSENEKLDFLYGIWTLKESYVKAIGQGLGIALNSFEVLKKNNIDKYFLKKYNIDNNYKLSVCSESYDFPESVQIIDQKHLIKEFYQFV